MASDLIVGPKSILASADLSAKQFTFVVMNAAGQLITPLFSGHATIGVLQDKPTAQGQPGQVCRPGDISKIYCGGSVNAGDFVTTDTNGKAITATSGTEVAGQAMDAGASGSIIRIVYQPMGKL